MTANTFQKTRIAGLDFYRSFALLLVMVIHFVTHIGAPLNALLRTGFWSVDLFFVLSGYLVSTQIFRSFARGERPRVLPFYFNRVSRTWPAYFLVLPLYFFFFPAEDVQLFPPLLRLLTFTQNLDMQPNRLAFTWSLCIEEQFYLVLPWLCLAFWGRLKRRGLILMAVVLVIGGMLLRAWLSTEVLSSPDRVASYLKLVYFPIWSRLDSLVAGVMLAALRIFWPGTFAKAAARSGILLALGLMFVVAGCLIHVRLVTTPAMIFGFPLIAIGLFFLVFEAVSGRSVFDRKKIPGAEHVATTSYSIYLIHPLVFLGVIHAFRATGVPEASWLCFLTCMAGSILVGTLMYRVVEKPVFRARDHVVARMKW